MYTVQYDSHLSSSEYVLHTLTKFGLGDNNTRVVQIQTAPCSAYQLQNENHSEYIEKHVEEIILPDGRRKHHSSISGTNEQEVLRQAEMYN